MNRIHREGETRSWGIDGARLGTAAWFHNDIHRHLCFPLDIRGRTEMWLSRAHLTADRILVRRCEESTDGALAVPSGYWGWALPVWDQMIIDSDGSLRFLPLDLPRWTFLANPAFCDALVAYWGLEDDDGEHSFLLPTVFDLAAGAVVQANNIGSVELRTDWEGALDRPVWNATCQAAEFNGDAVDRPTTILTVNR